MEVNFKAELILPEDLAKEFEQLCKIKGITQAEIMAKVVRGVGKQLLKELKAMPDNPPLAYNEVKTDQGPMKRG